MAQQQVLICGAHGAQVNAVRPTMRCSVTDQHGCRCRTTVDISILVVCS